MGKSIELLKNYSKEKHRDLLYSTFDVIPFSIHTINSEVWEEELWLNGHEVPYVSLTHLLDSYDCLPERPDMGFTFLWKAINNTYKELGVNKKILQSDTSRLSDSDGINYLINEIDNIKTLSVSTEYSVLELIEEYVSLMPMKPLKFVSNYVLKGNTMENSNILPILRGSSYASFKSNHSDIFNKIKNTYGNAYNNITNPVIVNSKCNLNITEFEKSKSIPKSLAVKLRELLVNRTSIISNSNQSQDYTLSLSDDKEYFKFLIKTILYAIRNNSVHGNLVSRLNSEYSSVGSLKTAIYIYFLGHLFLSLGLYINDKIEVNNLSNNIKNLELLKSLL
ncbi:hypothetical protein SAMN04487765_0462 [Tenacibaculum sp. MAR_2010_89]|uniref:hypothetical protein n=1 Tax=Tenacibaculum sp. MAR_2010_89 TaxID=1250198 RepID=UPI000897C54B|nr:hypothetical protein [Tenacibaculum sp. MAR_2010_89]SED59841.1 hypothetical protein SAMN04487765_0462 [Tenacibaculum sp. MAR_2010_89]